MHGQTRGLDPRPESTYVMKCGLINRDQQNYSKRLAAPIASRDAAAVAEKVVMALSSGPQAKPV